MPRPPLSPIGPPFKWKFNPTIYGVWFFCHYKWHLYDHSTFYKKYVRTGNKTNGGKAQCFTMLVRHYTHCGKLIPHGVPIKTRFNLFCLYPIYKRWRYPIHFCPECYARSIQRLKDDGFYLSQCEKERSKLKSKGVKLKDESKYQDRL